MKEGLRGQAISGFGWRAVERYSTQSAQFLVSIVLARILTPHEFGLIALVMVFVSFGQVLIDGGFSDALVQSEHADDACCSSVFFCNIVVGLLCAGLLSFSAPVIAGFYKEDQLRHIIPTLSLNFIISSCGLVYSALLVKRLRFKSLAKVSVISTVVSGAVGVLLAVNHFGVWSLVGQSLSAQLARLFSLWTFTVWRPRVWFEWAAIKTIAPFGSRVLIATITESLFGNLNVIAIGKLFTPTTLGFYSRADSLWSMTMSNFSSVLGSVAFPILSTIKNSPERLKRALKSAVEMLAFVSYPAAIGLVVVAHPLVLALLTRKWEPCVPFLQLLGAVWALYPMHAINLSVLLAQGHSREYLRLQLIKKAIGLILLPLLFLGIYPFIFGQIASSCISYFINCYYSGKLLQYPMSAQLRDSLPYIGCAVLMGFCIQSVRFLHLSHVALELVLEIGLGMVSYVLFCWWFRLPALAKAWEIIRNYRAQNKALTPMKVKAVS
jgi:O-antigen/teichoic acid export membrane protein